MESKPRVHGARVAVLIVVLAGIPHLIGLFDPIGFNNGVGVGYWLLAEFSEFGRIIRGVAPTLPVDWWLPDFMATGAAELVFLMACVCLLASRRHSRGIGFIVLASWCAIPLSFLVRGTVGDMMRYLTNLTSGDFPVEQSWLLSFLLLALGAVYLSWNPPVKHEIARGSTDAESVTIER
jgi:hypothetical protein